MKLVVNSPDSILTFARFPREYADDYMHDAIVDCDPHFLEWNDVDRYRHGRMSSFTHGIDSLPLELEVAS